MFVFIIECDSKRIEALTEKLAELGHIATVSDPDLGRDQLVADFREYLKACDGPALIIIGHSTLVGEPFDSVPMLRDWAGGRQKSCFVVYREDSFLDYFPKMMEAGIQPTYRVLNKGTLSLEIGAIFRALWQQGAQFEIREGVV